MAAYAVFFCDAVGCSIEPVRAMDEDHAKQIVQSRSPGVRRVAAIPETDLEGVDQQQLLVDWIRARS
jgi:hypothetical protein